MSKLPKVVLIGRANVGKSTLFNRLTEKKKAIVSLIPGTTRDRNYADIFWQGCSFSLVDTGGLDLIHDQSLAEAIIKQSQTALIEADLIIFLVDLKSGLMPQDKVIARLLRPRQKNLLLVANKADNERLKKQLADFYQLGLGEPVPVSAGNGSGTGDLLDLITKRLKGLKKKSKPEEMLNAPIKLAIIGKPNVGKSSLVNAILGEDRMITGAKPYTTRDAQDINLTYQGQNYTLIDTAGIRKQNKIGPGLEKESVAQALKSVAQADVTLLVTDVNQKLTKQDQHLSEVILQSRTSLMIIANKWDLIPAKDDQTINRFTKYYRRFFPYLSFAPIIFTSALRKQRLKNILDLTKKVYQERFTEIPEPELAQFFKAVLKKQPPARGKGTKKPVLYGLKQTGVNPPRLEIVKDYQSDLHFSYFRFIENQLRENFSFLGTPIIINVRRLK